jgi:hypothetical protein
MGYRHYMFMSISCVTWIHSYLRIRLQFGDVLGRYFTDRHAVKKKTKPSNGLTQKVLPVLLAEKGMQSEAPGAGGDI